MKASRSLRSFLLLLILLSLFSQSSCALLNSGGTTLPTLGITQSFTHSPTPPFLPTQTKNNLPANTPTSTADIPPRQILQQSKPASTPVSERVCNKAAPGSPIDITIPDNTEMYPGQAFTKIWRLVNIGHCSWTPEYTAEWFSGEKFGDVQVVSLGTVVAHQQSIDIVVDMIAPLQPGTHQSNWKLRSPDDQWFGIGPNGDQAFWVRIIVVPISTSTPTPTATEVPPSPTSTSTITPTLTLTPTATPIVLVSSSVELDSGDVLDLDTAQVNIEGEDLTFVKDQASHHWLTPLNDAVLGVYGSGVPPLHVCQSANMSMAPIPIESLSPNTYLCYRTNQGLLGWLRYDSFNLETASLALSILTWDTPLNGTITP